MSPEALENWKKARWRARTDLLYLCNYVLGYKDVNRRIHGGLIDVLQKFPKPNKQQFEENDRLVGKNWVYTPVTPMEELRCSSKVLILDSRGFMKTTINIMAHTIQWIINYPDVALMVVQSNTEKAELFMREIKAHFTNNPVFRELFPEHCPDAKKGHDWGTLKYFNTEARSPSCTRRENTVMTASIDKGVAGIHVDVLKFSDIVEANNSGDAMQCSRVYRNFLLMHDLLVSPLYWIDVEGTRYSFCLDGDTPITMANWSQKNIKDIRVGDTVVGWKDDPDPRGYRDRSLVKTEVLACGTYERETNKYTFESGRSVICTPDHQWWRGPRWNKNGYSNDRDPKGRISNEYGMLGTGKRANEMKSLRSLMIPSAFKDTGSHGWLSGMFDGEGTVSKNPGHPSGGISICQSMHNPNVIERLRETIPACGFEFSESWHKPSEAKGGQEHWKDRCNFSINGGWKARYKFLVELAPTRRKKIEDSLFAQLATESDRLVSVEPAGTRTVYWFETTTGNYIANGYCSKNSDTYGEIIDKQKKLRPEDRSWKFYMNACFEKDIEGPRTYGIEELDIPFKKTPEGQFISRWEDRFSLKDLLEKQRNDAQLFACQQLNNPVSADDGRQIFPVSKNLPLKIEPAAYRNVKIAYKEIVIDTAETDNKRSDYSAITVGAWDTAGRLFIEQIYHGKFLPDQLISLLVNALLLHRPRYVNIEETSFVRGLKASLLAELHRKGLFIPIRFIKRDNQASKTERITNTLQPWYKGGYLRFVVGPPDQNPGGNLAIGIQDATWNHLRDELGRFPQYKHDDILDTLADFFQNKTWFGREGARPADHADATTMAEKQRDKALRGILGLEEDLEILQPHKNHRPTYGTTTIL